MSGCSRSGVRDDRREGDLSANSTTDEMDGHVGCQHVQGPRGHNSSKKRSSPGDIHPHVNTHIQTQNWRAFVLLGNKTFSILVKTCRLIPQPGPRSLTDMD